MHRGVRLRSTLAGRAVCAAHQLRCQPAGPAPGTRPPGLRPHRPPPGAGYGLRVPAVRALLLVAAALPVALLGPHPAAARGFPSWAKGGYLHVELGAPYDSNGLPSDFADGKGSSVYPDGHIHNGHVWNLGSGGLLHHGAASTPDAVYAWHNKKWSYAASVAGTPLPVPSAAPSSSINLVTKKTSSGGADDTRIRYAFGTPGAYQPQPATKVHFMVTGINQTNRYEGEAVGEVSVYQLDPSTGTVAESKTQLLLGTNIRSFKDDKDFCSECTTLVPDTSSGKLEWKKKKVKLVVTRTDSAGELWSGNCEGQPAGGLDKCFADKVTVELGAEGLTKPVVGVEVRAFAKKTWVQIGESNLDIYGGLRLHGITLERNFKVSKSGTGPVTLNQASAPWGQERYGGWSEGGVVYGRKSTLQVYGCAMTGATIVGNYLTGASKTPGDLNTHLQNNHGYGAASPVATISEYGAQLASRCVAFMAGSGVASESDWCTAALAPAAKAAVGTMCCRLLQAAAAGQLASAAAGTWELQDAGCNPGNNTCTSTQIFGPYVGFGMNEPAVLTGTGPAARMALDAATGGVHVFSDTNCSLLTWTGFTDVRVNNGDGRPCRNGLYLATAADVIDAGAVAVGASVGFYTMVSWDVVATLFTSGGTAIGYDSAASATAETPGAVEALLASGLAPLLYVRNGAHPHFVVATGYKPLFFKPGGAWAAGVTATGVHTTSGKEMIGTLHISDPGWSAHKDLIDATWDTGHGPSVDELANSWSTLRLLRPGVTDPTLSVTILSPAELLLSDSKGLRIGRYAKEGIEVATLPGATYEPVLLSAAKPGSKQATTLLEPGGGWQIEVPAAKGTYRVAVIGTGFGPFTLRARMAKPGQPAGLAAVRDTVWPGRVLTWTIQTDSQVPLLKPDAAAVDSDGDGVVDLADCATGSKAVHPGALESCANGLDDDCDGATDAADASCKPGAKPCPDADKDGYADCLVPGCAPQGKCGDCDDTDPATHPGATEGGASLVACSDGRDNDCDGRRDLDEKSCAGSVADAATMAKLAATGGGGGEDAGAIDQDAGAGDDGGSGDGGGSPDQWAADAGSSGQTGLDGTAGPQEDVNQGALDDQVAAKDASPSGDGGLHGADVPTCTPDVSQDAGSLTDGGAPAGSDAVVADQPETGTQPAAQGNREGEPDGGCSVGRRSTPPGPAALMLALVLALLLSQRRRRTRDLPAPA